MFRVWGGQVEFLCGGPVGPLTFNSLILPAGFPEGRPIKIITDSIGKALPNNRLWYHVLMSGKSLSDATERIYEHSIAIGGLRVIVFHLGTNSICFRNWGHIMTWQQRLEQLKEEVKSLHQAVRQFNGTAFVIFSAVLPRKCDWMETRELYFGFNRALRQFCRSKNCGFMTTYNSFIHKSGPCKDQPLAHLFARNDGGLHLNLAGRYIFSERFKMALSPKQLLAMAKCAGFKYV